MTGLEPSLARVSDEPATRAEVTEVVVPEDFSGELYKKFTS
jgi:hypothetical protein